MRALLVEVGACLALIACGSNDAASQSAATSTVEPTLPGSTSAAPDTPVAAPCFDEDVVAVSATPVGITSSGDVVGNIMALDVNDGATHAFVWSAGQAVQLPSLGGGSGGTYALGMNDAGDVVGVASRPGETGTPSHPALWRNGAAIDLGDFGGGSGSAKHVNAKGDVTGFASLADGMNHAFLWHAGTLDDLGAFIPDGINDAGQVLAHATSTLSLLNGGTTTPLGAFDSFAGLAADGSVAFGSSGHAYLWASGAKSELVAYADETWLQPTAFTADGILLGTATRASGEVAGFIRQSSVTTTLSGSFVPAAVNAHGVVAGYVGLQAALWKGGTTVLLSTATPRGAYATGVNDAGQAVGEVDLDSGPVVRRWSTSGCF